MIEVPRYGSFRAHGQNQMGLYLANAASQIANDAIKVRPVESAIRIVKYLRLSNLKYFARGRKLSATNGGKLFSGSGSAPVGCRLAGRKTDNISFNSAGAVEKQRTAKCSNFIIRVSRNAQ
jgi:hypothetical protein